MVVPLVIWALVVIRVWILTGVAGAVIALMEGTIQAGFSRSKLLVGEAPSVGGLKFFKTVNSVPSGVSLKMVPPSLVPPPTVVPYKFPSLACIKPPTGLPSSVA